MCKRATAILIENLSQYDHVWDFNKERIGAMSLVLLLKTAVDLLRLYFSIGRSLQLYNDMNVQVDDII